MDDRIMTLQGRIIDAVDHGDQIAEDAAREELERLRPRSARDLVRPVLEPSR